MTQEFKISKSGHPILRGLINGKMARFIIDTGAGVSCIDTTYEDYGLSAYPSDSGMVGATGSEDVSFICEPAKFSVSGYRQNVSFVVMDLFHLNNALIRYGTKPVHGIIGADILTKGGALIDYNRKNITLTVSK